ncbi:MAG: hypothetical protein AAFZ87_03655 [Planctomycetota bacterium]
MIRTDARPAGALRAGALLGALAGALLVPVAVAAGFAAQDPALEVTPQAADEGPDQEGAGVRDAVEPLRPVPPQRPGHARSPFSERPAESALEILENVDARDFEETIRDDLRRADLDAREAAFDRWSAAAATDARVADALRSIQTDAADPDTAFLARLALRGAGGPRVGARRLAPGSVFGGRVFGRADGRDPFRSIEDMRRRMDEVFGSDPFFGGPLGADPFLGGGSPLRPRIRDEDLQRRLEEMQRELDALLGQGPGGLPRAGRGLQRRVSGVSVRRGPNGVYVEVTEEGPDGFETNTYEAPSMDALLEAHPELRGRVR